MSDQHLDKTYQIYAYAIRRLLQGVVYHDDTKAWKQIRTYQTAITQYFGQINLILYFDDLNGFAYLKDNTDDDSLPPIITRRSLTLEQTFLVVLLRERLDEYENRDMLGGVLYLSYQDIYDMMRIFMPEQADERKTEKRLNGLLDKMKEYGFLREEGNHKRYEVRRILRAKISAEELVSIRTKLQQLSQQNHTMESSDEEFTE
jgi:hypothetical protein